MNDSVWIVLALGAAVILAVLVYNMYQENQYRKQVREQFGHANKDALLDSEIHSVRDGQSAATTAPPATAPKPVRETNLADLTPPTAAEVMPKEIAVKEINEVAETLAAEPATEAAEPVLQPEATPLANAFQFIKRHKPQPAPVAADKKPLLDVQDMAQQPLPWFDARFDYLAYIGLHEPQELHALPRLSSRHRFRMVGCTMDNRFQVAEPIPSVYYQGFVVGLQAISRSGLAGQDELAQFGEQVSRFAEGMNGTLLLTDVDAFLALARPLDELCARVDQTIAIHLVSRNNISGTELRAAVESQGFELSHDGAFYFPNERGEPLFSIVTLDNTPFTATLLSTQTYRGFSMLFDVVHVPNGEKHFNQFMDLAVKLSSKLGLDLVNDKLEELSTQWLKEVRRYVVERQGEMKQVDIEPGSELAQRLFS